MPQIVKAEVRRPAARPMPHETCFTAPENNDASSNTPNSPGTMRPAAKPPIGRSRSTCRLPRYSWRPLAKSVGTRVYGGALLCVSPEGGRIMMCWRRVLPGLLPALLLVGCSTSGEESTATIRVASPPSSTSVAPVSADGAALRAATVRIETTGSYVTPEIGSLATLVGSGSGFVIDESGLIVTNNHVVAGAAIVEVFFDGQPASVAGHVVATSECSDLAVVDVDGSGYTAVAWEDAPVTTGTSVQAAGFPDGDPEYTLTQGIVSRESVDGATPWASISSLIQHDADLRPGNSGGPLVDAAGRVVGVNVAASSTGRFAVPSSVARPVIDTLVQGTDVDSIGINAQAVWDETTNESGVWVVSVTTGSPADEAGLLPGDVITRMKGLRVALDGTLNDFCGVVRSAGGGLIPIEVKRDQEFFGGDVFGEGLKPVLSVIDDTSEAAEQPASGGLPVAGDAYVEYVRVQDDTGSIAFDVPAAWTDVRTMEVSMAGAPRPAIAAATDIDALDAASAATFDQPGVAAIVFDVGAPIEKTFDVVVMQNSPWANECSDVAHRSFDDGGYRGVFAVFAGCNGSSMVVSMAIERIGSNRWMLLNVFAPTLAEVEAAGRILETFDFLGDAGGTGGGDAPTASTPPTTVLPAPTTVLPAPLPTATATQALAAEIGAPTADALVAETTTLETMFVIDYEHAGNDAGVKAWVEAFQARLGCTNVYLDEQPATAEDPTAWFAVSCDVVRNASTFTVTVHSLTIDLNGYTTVMVSQW